jgi:TRAP-type mannitol/chloroaromatic compound transport system permease small subunit
LLFWKADLGGLMADVALTQEPAGAVARFIGFADRVAIAGAWLAMFCLVGMTLLMFAQIVVSTVSKFVPAVRGDIPVAWEYSSYLMGATFMLGAGMTLRAGRHIRLGIVIGNTRARVRWVLELFSSLVSFGFVAFLTYSLGRAALRAFALGSASVGSNTPTWIPMAVFAVGAAIFALQFLARVLACIAGQPLENKALQMAMGEVE